MQGATLAQPGARHCYNARKLFTRSCQMLQPQILSGRIADALGTVHPPATPDARIVSLVPSITELLCELGLHEQLVGRTGFCIHPRDTLRKIPKVGGTKDVKLEMIRALAPTHVIVNIDENRRETVDALSAFVPHIVVTHPCTPHDNHHLYRLLGAIFDREVMAARLSAELAAAIEHTRSQSFPAERVLYLIWREPWMTVSRETYVSAMLAYAGWQTLPVDCELRYPSFEWDAPWLTGVDRVLLSSEPYCFRDRHLEEVAALSRRPVTLIDGEMVSWYGSRAIAGMRYLASIRAHHAG